jgi:hypothetical protein
LKGRNYYIQVRGYEIKGVQVAYEEKDSIFLERYKQLVFNKNTRKTKISYFHE